MDVRVQNIELFEDLFENVGLNNDLHNDYLLVQLAIDDNQMRVTFQHSQDNSRIAITFKNVTIVKLHANYNGHDNAQTLDNIYRGKYLVDNKLEEIDSIGRGYVYMECYDDLSVEFLCESINIVEN